MHTDPQTARTSHISGDARVAAAIHAIAAAPAGQAPDLRALAACAGLSRFHFQRLFSADAGVSPKRLWQHLSAERARALLQAPRHDDTLSVTCALNLSSTSRLYDLTVKVFAASPPQVRARGQGMTLRWGVHPSPWGLVMLALSDLGLCALSFLDAASAPSDTPSDTPTPPDDLRHQWPLAHFLHDPDATRAPWSQIFHASPDGTPHPAQPLHLHLHGTNLQVRVWAALLALSPGQTLSYGALAHGLDLGGPRVAAAAVAANPIAALIPCHRVLRACGALAGYRWGLARKAALLYHEATR